MEKWLALLHSVICRKCLISGSLHCILLSFELYYVQIKIITKCGGFDIIRCKTSLINRDVVCYAHVSMAEVSWTCEQTVCLCDVRTVLDK